jgi:amidase
MGTPVHPDCVAAVHDAAALCADLGHAVVEAAPAVNAEAFNSAFLTLVWATAAAIIDGWAKKTGRTPSADLIEPTTWAVYQMGRQQGAAAYILAIRELHRAGRDAARFFVDHDLWLTPTLGEPPVPLGSFDSPPENPLQGLARIMTFMPFTPISNATGQPAMSVPLYWNADGLPIGTQFVARFGDEATLFRLAAQLEQARPWAERRPPVCA